MEEREKKQIIGSVDVFIAVIFIVIGILLIVLGIMFSDSILTDIITYMNIIVWIIVLVGIATIVYGVKRILDDAIII